MNKQIPILRILKWIDKNARTIQSNVENKAERRYIGNIHADLASYGFYLNPVFQQSAALAEFRKFVKQVRKMKPHRRRAVFRVARAALKRGTLVDIADFCPRDMWMDGWEEPESDLRKILFIKDKEAEKIKKKIAGHFRELKNHASVLKNEFKMSKEIFTNIYDEV